MVSRAYDVRRAREEGERGVMRTAGADVLLQGDVGKGGGMSESLTAEGWRVNGEVAGEPVVDASERFIDLSLPRRRYRRGALVRRTLLVADVLGLAFSFVLANLLVPSGTLGDRITPGFEYLAFFLAIPGWLLLLRLEGLYDRDEERTDHSTVDDIVGVFRSVTIGVWVFALFGVATGLVQPVLSRLGAFWALAVVLIPTLRALARTLCRHLPGYTQNAVIVGAGNVGQQLAVKLMNHREYRIRLVGFVDDRPTELDDELAERLPLLLGGPERLRECILEHGVERVIFAFSNDSHEAVLANIRAIRDLDVQIDIVPRYFEVFGAGAQVHTLEGIPLVGLRPTRLARSSRVLKRAFDLCAATLGLLVLAPLFVTVAIAIKVESRGPVFFRQVRRGANGSTFRIYKFRTMFSDAEERKAEVVHLNMHRNRDPRMTKIPDDPRVTTVGRLLRRFSIDELPQLINVVNGEMSLVGPRPLILEEDQYVQEWARKRLDIKPGITGLWQVLGRSDIPFDEMTKLDYVYVTNWSLREDIRLIFLTVPSLFRTRRAF
jgi:exopolysaccharide biosynthesis polyprenyl glycosylphosphotransferase